MNDSMTSHLPALDDAMRKIAVSQNSATALREAFAPHFRKAHDLAQEAARIAPEDAKNARVVRLAMKSARTAAEHTRKEQKEDSLRFGKAVDGIYNVLEFQVVPLEKALLEIEEAEERAEARRKESLRASRAEALRPYLDPALVGDLANMLEEAFKILLDGAARAHNERIAAAEMAKKEEAERQRIAEEQRKEKEEADRVEREKMRAENERLADEAAKERKAREESEAAAAAAAKKAKAEADALAAAEKKRLDSEREKQQEIARIEREKREAAEAVLAKIEHERKAKEDAEKAAAKRAKAAPDKEKVASLARQVRTLQVPVLASDTGPALSARIAEQIAKFATWLDAEAGKL